EIQAFGDGTAHNGHGRNSRGITGDYMEHSRWKGANTCFAAIGRDHLAPTIEHILAAQLLVDLEFDTLAIEVISQGVKTALKNTFFQRVCCKTGLQCLIDNTIWIPSQPVAQGH